MLSRAVKRSLGNFLRPYVERLVMPAVRREYTVMPRFLYHQPLDYNLSTNPSAFDPLISFPGEALPLPGPNDRMGYHPNDDRGYLNTGKYDHDLVLQFVTRSCQTRGEPFRILDFGCSSGRVLRHFDKERVAAGWDLYGVDIQARPIEWMRQHFPAHFRVCTGSTIPHLPFEDGYFDCIYGISVFTHIKFLWDTWLLELRRVMKRGGLLIQTIHAEPAWEFYYKHRAEEWVRRNHAPEVLRQPTMNVDYFYYGDATVSQVFWKADVARAFWGRYWDVLEITPPPVQYSFQNWIVARK
jgi:SAM-dependent methyltransferase